MVVYSHRMERLFVSGRTFSRPESFIKEPVLDLPIDIYTYLAPRTKTGLDQNAASSMVRLVLGVVNRLKVRENDMNSSSVSMPKPSCCYFMPNDSWTPRSFQDTGWPWELASEISVMFAKPSPLEG